ncbi:IS3 family transposase [Paenibacillus alvei]|uniref:IS3 family transposase n=1 Tax=Paenibacillus alvei TaxID=44250 RepID=UPI0010FF3511
MRSKSVTNQLHFHSLENLKLELNDYANCYNKQRIYVTLRSNSLVLRKLFKVSKSN